MCFTSCFNRASLSKLCYLERALYYVRSSNNTKALPFASSPTITSDYPQELLNGGRTCPANKSASGFECHTTGRHGPGQH